MKATILINKRYTIGDVDKRIYGSFIEHLGRAVYGGIYEPTHTSANEQGFRQDVLKLVKRIDVPIVRYPGGNFLSGYYWEDGTGDKSKRPKKLDLAWKSIETNEVGIDEFQQWAKLANSEIMLAVNLGTRGAQDAQNLLEYCNLDTDSYYANLRKTNGYMQPFAIKTWGLGNEMDGTWQIGHKTANEYGRLAAETARLMRWVDSTIELVVCGSNNFDMPTYGEWDLTVLEHTYELVDYISVHQYYDTTLNNNVQDHLGLSVHFDQVIESMISLCDAMKAKKRSKKSINIALDEWGIWHNCNGNGNWEVAPPLLENIYTFEDALLLGSMLMTIQNHCDRVKIGCLAQLVNVLAPIMTKNNGTVWTQTIFYPYMFGSVYGRGTVLNAIVDCESYKTTDGLDVPYLNISVIDNKEKRELIVFAINRSLDEDLECLFELQGFETALLSEHVELYSDDLKCVNTAKKQAVTPSYREISKQIVLKKHSWNMLRYTY